MSREDYERDRAAAAERQRRETLARIRNESDAEEHRSMITVSIHENDTTGRKLLRCQKMTHVPREGERIILKHDTLGDEVWIVREVTYDMRRPETWVEMTVIKAKKI